MVLHSRGCGRVARRRFTRIGPPGRAFGSREAPFFLSSLFGLPVELTLREPFFVRCAGPPAGARCPGGRKAFPVPGRLGLFRAPKGNFCCSTKTSGEQILFSERAFDTVYDTVF